MTLRKSSLFILVTYIIAFSGRYFFGYFPNATINVTTALYIIGALVMIGIF